MGDAVSTQEIIKRSIAYSIFPAVIAATFWDSGFVVMVGIFVVLLPFEIALFWIGDRVVHMRKKRDPPKKWLDLR
jgi:hypothetical protein